MPERMIGVLGGMGPEATLDFFREIIELTPARKDQDHVPVLIYSNPRIPDRAAAILHGGEDPLPDLVCAARVLERDGAGLIAIPCNTAHFYLDSLRAAVRIPVLNMIEEACRALKSEYPHAATVGLLATTGTVRMRIYEAVLEGEGIAVIVPPDREQDLVQCAIERIKGAAPRNDVRPVLKTACGNLMSRGAELVILGCTELPLALDSNDPACPTLNPTRILAQAAIDWALGRTA
jgi:aspartate racemase